MTIDGGSDELRGGPDRNPVRWPCWSRVTAAAFVALGVAWAAVAGLGDGGATGSGGSASPSSDPSSEPVPDPAPRVGLSGQPCLRTDHRHELTVSFAVVNVGERRVFVQALDPVLPLGGLRPTGGSIGHESCGDVRGNDGNNALDAGEAIVLSMTFELPDECPAPYPVQTDLELATSDDVGAVHQVLTVLSDLGGIRFRQCGDRG